MTTSGEHEGLLKRAVHKVEEEVEELLDRDDDDAFTKRPGAKDDTTGTR
jgi:hypothetical protein